PGAVLARVDVLRLGARDFAARERQRDARLLLRATFGPAVVPHARFDAVRGSQAGTHRGFGESVIGRQRPGRARARACARGWGRARVAGRGGGARGVIRGRPATVRRGFMGVAPLRGGVGLRGNVVAAQRGGSGGGCHVVAAVGGGSGGRCNVAAVGGGSECRCNVAAVGGGSGCRCNVVAAVGGGFGCRCDVA